MGLLFFQTRASAENTLSKKGHKEKETKFHCLLCVIYNWRPAWDTEGLTTHISYRVNENTIKSYDWLCQNALDFSCNIFWNFKKSVDDISGKYLTRFSSVVQWIHSAKKHKYSWSKRKSFIYLWKISELQQWHSALYQETCNFSFYKP